MASSSSTTRISPGSASGVTGSSALVVAFGGVLTGALCPSALASPGRYGELGMATAEEGSMVRRCS
jgi:hypothetical protein